MVLSLDVLLLVLLLDAISDGGDSDAFDDVSGAAVSVLDVMTVLLLVVVLHKRKQKKNNKRLKKERVYASFRCAF